MLPSAAMFTSLKSLYTLHTFTEILASHIPTVSVTIYSNCHGVHHNYTYIQEYIFISMLFLVAIE